jgi:hypothetical protein
MILDTGAVPRVVLRWSMWSATPASMFMLSHSIASFRAHFGRCAEYVVFTDDVRSVRAGLLVPATVVGYHDDGTADFIDDRPTKWRKWAPRCRWCPGSFEFVVDADVFLLDHPSELCEFIRLGAQRYLITQETAGVRYYGGFAPILAHLPFAINSGLVGQAPGADLSDELARAYALDSLLAASAESDHNEQGSVTYALAAELMAGQVQLLPPDTYCQVVDFRDPTAPRPDGMKLLHAVGWTHTAFWQAVPVLSRIHRLPAALPCSWRS